MNRTLASVLLSVAIGTTTASAQQMAGLTVLTITPTIVEQYSDTELDYYANLYYDALTYGYLWQNGSVIRQGSACCGTRSNGTGYADGYMSAPTMASTTYMAQTNHWVRAYFTEYVDSTIVYDDPYGFSLVSAGGYGGNATVYPPYNYPTSLYTVSADYYIASTYVALTSPPPQQPAPVIGGIQINGQVTNTALAGSTGYMSIYGQYLDGSPVVHVDGSGVSITGIQYASSGQINAYFQADSSAGLGTHNVTVSTNHGSSNPSVVTVVKLNVQSVRFTNSVAYKKDRIGGTDSITIPTWTPSSSDPAVYVRGAAMQASVTFSVSPVPSSPIPGARIEGAASNGGTFVGTGLSIPAASTFTANAQMTLPSSGTQFYNPLNISWKISAAGDACTSQCVAAGASSTQTYVTLAQPAGDVVLTYVHLAVSNPGATTAATAFQNTWSKFTPRNLATWQGNPLYYYKQGVGFNGCARDALPLVTYSTNGSGQCGSFMYLLQSALQMNGISSTLVGVGAKTPEGFLVKDWTFGTPSDPIQPEYKWRITLVNEEMGVGMVPSHVDNVYGDLTSLSTLGGQNTNPPSEKVFGSHYIIKVDPSIAPAGSGPYFDPSYGVWYSNQLDFETKAVSGYVKALGGDTGTTSHVRKASGLGNICFAVPKDSSCN